MSEEPKKKEDPKLKTIINQGPGKFWIAGKLVPPGGSIRVTESMAKELCGYKLLKDAATIIPGIDKVAELEEENKKLKADLAAATAPQIKK